MTLGVVSLGGPFYTLLASPVSYPDLLQGMLSARYTRQSVRVTNAGLSGEWAIDGVRRFEALVDASRPEVVMILEGANDLNGLGAAGVSRAAAALESMMKHARFRGARVMVATLPPQRPGGARVGDVTLVPRLNAEIKVLARGEDAILVDIFAAFGGDTTSLIGADGLHPTEAGYQRMAETFFASIRDNFERIPTGS